MTDEELAQSYLDEIQELRDEVERERAKGTALAELCNRLTRERREMAALLAQEGKNSGSKGFLSWPVGVVLGELTMRHQSEHLQLGRKIGTTRYIGGFTEIYAEGNSPAEVFAKLMGVPCEW